MKKRKSNSNGKGQESKHLKTKERREYPNYSPLEVFSQFVDPYSIESFFKTYWEKGPLIIKASERKNKSMLSADVVTQLFSLNDFKNILDSHSLQHERDVNMCFYKNGKRTDSKKTGQATSKKVLDEFKKGYTLQIHQPQRYQDSLWHLMEKLECLFHCLVGANVYITPPGTQGLGPHYDDVEVFILQTEGKKKWRLYQPLPGEELPMRYSIDLEESKIGEPTHEFVLEPGDIVYFPRGTIHQAATSEGGDSHSTHITFSTYQNNSIGAYMAEVMPTLIEDLMNRDVDFRRGMPHFLQDKNALSTAMMQLLKKMEVPEKLPLSSSSVDFMASRLPPFRCQEEDEPDIDLNIADKAVKIRWRFPEHVTWTTDSSLVEGDEDDDEDGDDDEDDDDDEEEKENGSTDQQAKEELVFVLHSLKNDRMSHMFSRKDEVRRPSVIKLPRKCESALEKLSNAAGAIDARELLADEPELRKTLLLSLCLENVLVIDK